MTIALSHIFGGKSHSRQHTNPDGSIGGFVPHDATVSTSSYIGRTAVIMSGANIGPGERIENGEIVMPNGRVLRFGSIPPRQLMSS